MLEEGGDGACVPLVRRFHWCGPRLKVGGLMLARIHKTEGASVIRNPPGHLSEIGQRV